MISKLNLYPSQSKWWNMKWLFLPPPPPQTWLPTRRTPAGNYMVNRRLETGSLCRKSWLHDRRIGETCTWNHIVQQGANWAASKINQPAIIIVFLPYSTSIGLVAQKGNFSFALSTQMEKNSPWIVDSGASNHMTSKANLFPKYILSSKNLMVLI